MAKAKFIPIPELRPQDIERFWSKVDIRGEDECWPWRAATNADGYGLFGLGKPRGRCFLANRIALFLTSGIDPKEHKACHSCDNPPCCNGLHLFAGTDADNVHDRIAKGRSVITNKGETHSSAKLTADQVREIRHRYVLIKANQTLGDIQKLWREFGIGPTAFRSIVRCEAWKDLL